MEVPRWLEEVCSRLREEWGAQRVYVVDAEASEDGQGPHLQALYLGVRGLGLPPAWAEEMASRVLGEVLGDGVEVRLLTSPELEVEFLLDRYLRDYIASHGGAVTLTGVDEASQRARVRFEGGCSGCPASLLTLTVGIQRTLRRHLPWLKKVEADNEPVEPDFGIEVDLSALAGGAGSSGGEKDEATERA